MPLHLNAAPQSLLNAMLNINKTLHSEIDSVIKKPKFSAWPDNVMVMQDKPIHFYVRAWAKLLFDVQEISKESEARISMLITWQARQAYRIINAAISSTQVNETLKQELIILREHLENCDEIHSLLDEIKNSELKPDIVCSGHGSGLSLSSRL